ncbi:hypothetical protein PRIPAC_75328 [Pristionchus pacificus]|uniref:C2H2-type domain-containing protein n=1 Tax=Pristionchus pacificus TaxID=54126 RepID=A0A2A6C6T8_PRIPA|nr:hypothetical protein PRIPAC_75328 [Pristionchus pacificus]|eukprot:PDM73879.1 hypothetical protein PRIPAC_41235 [Pristionchus pacificus]
MGDQLRLNRIHRLEGLRNTAFNFGGPIGIAFTRSCELIQTVVRDTTANLENIDFVLDSLINDNAKAAERDAQTAQYLFIHTLSPGQADLSLPTPECITIDDDDDDDEPTPSIPTPPAITESTPSAKRQIDAVSGNHNQTAAQPSGLTPVLKKVRIEATTPISDRSKRVVYDEDDSDDSYSSEDEVDRSLPFPCLHCDRKFKSQKARAQHTLTHEGVQCTICHRHMAQDKLKKHMKEQHRRRSGANVSDNKEAPAPMTLVDPGAPLSTPTAATIDYHLRNVHGVNLYKCECGAEFVRREEQE